MVRNVFVLGLDPHNEEVLRSLPHAEDYRFHPLLDIDELQSDEIDMPGLLAKAERRLDRADGSVDAIMGFWDFPVSTLVPILCERRGLPHAPLAAVVTCEHKYWSRLVQHEVVPEAVPKFALARFDSTSKPQGLNYPMWLKPVKAFSSELAFQVENDEEYRQAMSEIRDGAGRIGEPFQWVLDHITLPDEIEEAGGTACLAEESAHGRQLTVEGYVSRGSAHVYGVIDSELYPDSPSFLCYRYPSTLPDRVVQRMDSVSRLVIEHIGLNETTFNIEYFYDEETEEIRLLEVNPRHSQSHAKMFECVEGVANHDVLLHLALGEAPEGGGNGPYGSASKWFLRTFQDGFVRSVPTEDDVRRVEEEVPGTTIEIVAKAGERLSELSSQDSYSYELAEVFIGAADPQESADKFKACTEALPFEIDESEANGKDR